MMVHFSLFSQILLSSFLDGGSSSTEHCSVNRLEVAPPSFTSLVSSLQTLSVPSMMVHFFLPNSSVDGTVLTLLSSFFEGGSSFTEHCSLNRSEVAPRRHSSSNFVTELFFDGTLFSLKFLLWWYTFNSLEFLLGWWIKLHWTGRRLLLLLHVTRLQSSNFVTKFLLWWYTFLSQIPPLMVQF